LNPTEEANMSRWFAAAGVSCALALSGCALPPSEREEFEKTLPLRREGTFKLSNVNGSVAVESWEREEVEIRAIKTGSLVRDSLIEVTGGGDRVQVRTRLPHWFLSWGRGDTIVEYRVRVPDEVELELETVNGGVRVEDAAGRIDASTVNGAVVVRQSMGEVDAQTVNGFVDVACARVGRTGAYQLSAVNGWVALQVPEDVNGSFEGSTVNGWIRTDLPLSVSGALIGRNLSGRLGEGGPSFHLSTVNGSVAVRKSSTQQASR
jgi:hypothetical protein